MTNIISFILTLIKYLNKILFKFQTFLVNKYMKNDPSENPISEQYRKLQIDGMPIVEQKQLYDHKILLNNYQKTHGKPLKPVNRRSKFLPPKEASCPICCAPYEYIYDNSGGRGQLGCKVCKSTFYPDRDYIEKLVLKCPHCENALYKKRDRKQFFVYTCINKHCPFYVKNLTAMSNEERLDFEKNPYKYKLHYYYRIFDFDIKSLKKDPAKPSAVDISRIRNSKYILGLVLTYHINYGLSTRQTSSVIWDVHRVSISHQTVANYASAAARILKPFVDNYPYDLSECLAIVGDETYIKVLGKKHYVFFIMDGIKKILTSYSVFMHRDGIAAIKAIYETLSKFKRIPKNLTMIFDGNPIYILAKHFFAQHDINFDIKQVIGLTNKDETSKKYRWLKQITERLNRTFKGVYKGTNGFNSYDGAKEFTALFAGFFNFLRRHRSLGFNVPVNIPQVSAMPDMPSKWLKLLKLSCDFLEKVETMS